MDSAFETRTLAFTFDLLFDQAPASIGKAAGILWRDVLISPQFHNEVTLRVRDAFNKEYGLISKDFYNSNTKDIHRFISKSAGEHAKSSLASKKLEDLGPELEKSLKEIEGHFNHSKAGIWIDEAGKSVKVIVSMLAIAGYGIYSFRNTKLVQHLVNTASFFGLAEKTLHVGGIKLTGEVSNYSSSKSTVKLKASAVGKWKSIQVKAKSNGVVNFNTGQIMDSSTNLDMTYAINQKLQVNGGLSASTLLRENQKSEMSVYMKIKLTSGTNNFSLGCSITDNSDRPVNKECTASASVNF
jgi:hypothetical protein